MFEFHQFNIAILPATFRNAQVLALISATGYEKSRRTGSTPISRTSGQKFGH